MNNLLSEKLGNYFFSIPEHQVIDSWLQSLEIAVANNTIQTEYNDILTQVLQTQNPSTKWQGLGLFVMVLGDSRLWKELFSILKLMREFLEHEQLTPFQSGTWNHALYNLVSLFRITSNDDVAIAEILIEETSSFSVDAYELIQKIANYYFEKQNKIKFKEWSMKAYILEADLIQKQGINHEQLSALYNNSSSN